MTDRELMQMALDALEQNMQDERLGQWRQMDDAVTALRERLAAPSQEPDPQCPECGLFTCECDDAPSQEPVAWTTMPDSTEWEFVSGANNPNGKLLGVWHPLYTTPPDAAAQIAELSRISHEQFSMIMDMTEQIAKLKSALRKIEGWSDDYCSSTARKALNETI